MRTTLNIDDTLYNVVKELASQNNDTIGNTVSLLIEEALQSKTEQVFIPNDFPTLPSINNPKRVTTNDINSLREKLGV